jgi:Phage tail assembly chaperone proteins, E, or 41 or 14
MTETGKPADAPAPAPQPGYVLRLSQPIEAHGEKVSELRFRNPTTRDILEVGNPVIFDPISDPPKITHDAIKMNVMLSRLAGVPPSSILHLDPRDWVACAWGISPFFVPMPGTT